MSQTPSDALAQAAARWLPRILTQIDRDPLSASFGCADRDWWHYRIRDFPSLILQQSGYTLWCAAQLPQHAQDAAWFGQLAAGSVAFWARRACRMRAFEEYYPWEEGYPPLAFSTLAAAKLIAAGALPAEAPQLRDAATVAATQLRRRFEADALNQQVAGLAALLWLERAFASLANPAATDALLARTLATQHDEGWFPEYGGPDLGYLAVTLDCLWDAYDACADTRLLDAIRRAATFLGDALAVFGRSTGMHNARNTDYIAPYGLARALVQWPNAVHLSALVATLDTHSDPAHFLLSTDERYLCHYLGHSVLRAVAPLAQAQAAAPPQPVAAPAAFVRVGAGYWSTDLPAARALPAARLLVSLRKGGIVSLGCGSETPWTDHGVRVDRGARWWVSHWWTDAWHHGIDADTVHVHGQLVGGRDIESTPLKHAVLRVASLLLGQRLIRALKNVLIFRKPGDGPRYVRRIRVASDRVVIEDEIGGLRPDDTVRRAPRASKRHVASADSYHADDRPSDSAFRIERSEARTQDGWRGTTTVFLDRPRAGDTA